jgi:hypothetical protein
MNLEMYNKMVSDKLKKYDMDYAKNFDLVNISSNNELLSGGTKPRKYVMVGTDSSTYAPNFNAPEKLVGLSGGKKKKKSIYDNMDEFADGFVYGFTKPLEVGADIAKKVAPLMAAAGKSDLDKAKESLQKYVDGKKKTKPTKKHLDLLEEHGIISKEKEGGKVNRLKKAKRWTGFAVDTADKGLDLAEKGMKVFGGSSYNVSGGVNRLKKAKKWTGFAVDTADKGLDLAEKGMKVFGGAKKTSSWIAHVKKVAADKGIPYNQALKVAGASYKK